jgi:hypothetical protein
VSSKFPSFKAQIPPPADIPAVEHRKAGDIVIFLTRHDGKCAECGADFLKGSMIRVENDRPLCLECADLDHLEFLSRGDTALTRRATKHSPLRAVVVEWSRARNHYERQGILVTSAAIEQAEKECLADAEARERQRQRAAQYRESAESTDLAVTTAAIRAQYPGCPQDEAEEIAKWTCRKYSGRVGRSAAAKQFDSQALRLAVVAHIRHVHTHYDQLLMQYGDRELARQSAHSEIDRILRGWEQGRT